MIARATSIVATQKRLHCNQNLKFMKIYYFKLVLLHPVGHEVVTFSWAPSGVAFPINRKDIRCTIYHALNLERLLFLHWWLNQMSKTQL